MKKLFAAYLVFMASDYRPEARFALVASLLLIAALFAFSPLLFIANDLALRAAFEKNAKAWTEAQQRVEESGLTPNRHVNDERSDPAG